MARAGKLRAQPESLKRYELISEQRPTVIADRVGTAYAAGRSDEHRRRFGLYLTPPEVADFMAGMIEPKAHSMCLLDPDAGAGVLLCSALERLVAHPNRPQAIELVACEIDGELCAMLRLVMDQ